MSITMEDPKGSYYASMGRDQLKRELFDRDIALAQSQKREAELQRDNRLMNQTISSCSIDILHLQQECDRLREATVEECAKWIEQAEVLLPIDDWMGTKRDLTAKFATALAAQMRTELAKQALAGEKS